MLWSYFFSDNFPRWQPLSLNKYFWITQHGRATVAGQSGQVSAACDRLLRVPRRQPPHVQHFAVFLAVPPTSSRRAWCAKAWWWSTAWWTGHAVPQWWPPISWWRRACPRPRPSRRYPNPGPFGPTPDSFSSWQTMKTCSTRNPSGSICCDPISSLTIFPMTTPLLEQVLLDRTPGSGFLKKHCKSHTPPNIFVK